MRYAFWIFQLTLLFIEANAQASAPTCVGRELARAQAEVVTLHNISLAPNLSLEDLEAAVMPLGVRKQTRFLEVGSTIQYEFPDGTFLNVRVDETKKRVNAVAIYGSPDGPAEDAFKKLFAPLKEKKVFVDDPFLDAQREFNTYIKTNPPIHDAKPIKLKEPADWGARNTDVALVPDHHDKDFPVHSLKALISKGGMDWVGLEMLPASLQKEIDAYLNGDSEFVIFRAKKLLTESLKRKWTKDDVPERTVDSYLSILDMAKEKGIRVIGLDTDRNEIPLRDANFPGSEDPYMLGFRSYYWAQSIPKEGRGLVFGGAGHFTPDHYPFTFQDFVPASRRVFIFQDLQDYAIPPGNK